MRKEAILLLSDVVFFDLIQKRTVAFMFRQVLPTSGGLVRLGRVLPCGRALNRMVQGGGTATACQTGSVTLTRVRLCVPLIRGTIGGSMFRRASLPHRVYHPRFRRIFLDFYRSASYNISCYEKLHLRNSLKFHWLCLKRYLFRRCLIRRSKPCLECYTDQYKHS